MATETLTAVSANVLLNGGVSPTGNIRTIKQSIGTMSPNASDWNADKVLAIAAALENVLDYGVYQVNGVKTFLLDTNS